MTAQLDALDHADASFLATLEALPGSYEGPDGVRPEPYGFIAFGENSDLPNVMRPWFDAPVVTTGTQFLLSTAFDFGELGPLRITSEMSRAEVVTLGARVHEPDLHIPAGPLSLYTASCYLGFATGHGEQVGRIESVLRTIADRCRSEAPTEINPAKTLAWTLWNRVPLIVANRANTGMPALIQRVFARIGKSLAIPISEHPLELVTGALEGNHSLGDDLLALLVGPDDAELALVREVLKTRVAQVERLDFADLLEDHQDDPVVSNIAYWYLSLWTAAYMAILHGHAPADSVVYDEAGRAAQEG